MIVRHGQVAVEGWWAPYRAEDIHLLYSLSKSFLSSAIGFAVQEGLIGLDDLVVDFFPDETPKDASDNLKTMRVRHLLTMSTGHETEPDRSKGWVRTFMEWPVPKKPGTHFLYNSMATFMLSAILQKITGITAFDYLKPRLLEPLGIEGSTWEETEEGITVGGWGMSIKTEDIAKFGQFYLQKGMWDGNRLLSESWVEQASSKQVDNSSNGNADWKVGYGFQFWRCVPNCYRGDGAFGQYCVVIPEHDMVIAITASVDDMQVVLDFAWKYLMPSNSGGSQQELDERLKALELKKPKGEYRPNIVGRTFEATEPTEFGKEVQFGFESDGGFVRRDGRKVNFGFDEWVRTEEVPWWRGPGPFGAAAAWTAPDTLTIRMLHLKEPSKITYEANFEGDNVTIKTTFGGMFIPAEGPTFKGKARS